MSNIPINLSIAFSPLTPRLRNSVCENRKIVLAASQAMNKASVQSIVLSGLFSLKRTSVASTEGPAIRGVAKGTIRGSSSNDSSPITPPLDGKIIRNATIKRIIPPLMAIA